MGEVGSGLTAVTSPLRSSRQCSTRWWMRTTLPCLGTGARRTDAITWDWLRTISESSTKVFPLPLLSFDLHFDIVLHLYIVCSTEFLIADLCAVEILFCCHEIIYQFSVYSLSFGLYTCPSSTAECRWRQNALHWIHLIAGPYET